MDIRSIRSDKTLYEGAIFSCPSIISSLEELTSSLSSLTSPADVSECVFPTAHMDEFEFDASPDVPSPRKSGFVENMNDFITEIISLEFSMINILEDLLIFAEHRWNLCFRDMPTPDLSRDSDSQVSFDDWDAESRRSDRKLCFNNLLKDFENSNGNCSSECGVRIHQFLELNTHLDKVNDFYLLVTRLSRTNEDYIRKQGSHLSKEKETRFLEDGEKLERFCERVNDKVSRYQQVIIKVNSILHLSH